MLATSSLKCWVWHTAGKMQPRLWAQLLAEMACVALAQAGCLAHTCCPPASRSEGMKINPEIERKRWIKRISSVPCPDRLRSILSARRHKNEVNVTIIGISGRRCCDHECVGGKRALDSLARNSLGTWNEKLRHTQVRKQARHRPAYSSLKLVDDQPYAELEMPQEAVAQAHRRLWQRFLRLLP
jgi:hypothetical protein